MLRRKETGAVWGEDIASAGEIFIDGSSRLSSNRDKDAVFACVAAQLLMALALPPLVARAPVPRFLCSIEAGCGCLENDVRTQSRKLREYFRGIDIGADGDAKGNFWMLNWLYYRPRRKPVGFLIDYGFLAIDAL